MMGGNSTGVTPQDELRKQPEFDTYVRMEKEELSQEQIRNAMKLDGVGNNDQETFFGTSSSEPSTSAAPPPPESESLTPAATPGPKVSASSAVRAMAERAAAMASDTRQAKIQEKFKDLGGDVLPDVNTTYGDSVPIVVKYTDPGYYAALQKAAEKEESGEKARQARIERQAEEAGEAAKKKAKEEGDSDENAKTRAEQAVTKAREEAEINVPKPTRKYRDAYAKAKEQVEEVDAELKRKKKEKQDSIAAAKKPEETAAEQRKTEATQVFARLVTAAFGSVPMASSQYEKEHKQKIVDFKKAYAKDPQDRNAVLNYLEKLREALPKDKQKHFADDAFEKAVAYVQEENAKKAKAKSPSRALSTTAPGSKKDVDPSIVAGETLDKVLDKLGKDHIKYGKYARMFKIGLPYGAVLNAMALDKVSEEEIRAAAKGLPDPSTPPM